MGFEVSDMKIKKFFFVHFEKEWILHFKKIYIYDFKKIQTITIITIIRKKLKMMRIM